MGKGRPQRQTVKEIRTPSGVTSPAKGAVASNRRQVMSGLRHLRAPKIAAVIAALIFSLPGVDWSKIDHCELFAGEMAVSRAEREEGRVAAALDIRYDAQFHDINRPEGFVHSAYQILRMPPGSFLTLAPVCSTWVFMSRGSTGRTLQQPLGWQSAPSVISANLMVARVAILLLLASSKSIWWILEQPRGSLLEHHPLMEQVFARIRTWRQHIRMEDYAADTDKGTWLYSSRSEIGEIVDFKPLRLPPRRPKEMAIVYRDSSGRQRVKGGRHLKQSQAYPIQFGRALARLRSKHRARCIRDAKDFLARAAQTPTPSRMGPSFTNKSWIKQAGLESVVDYLIEVSAEK